MTSPERCARSRVGPRTGPHSARSSVVGCRLCQHPQESSGLRGRSTSAWEEVDSRPATLIDQSIQITITTNASRFLNSSTGDIKIKLSERPLVPPMLMVWYCKVDQATLTLVPGFVP